LISLYMFLSLSHYSVSSMRVGIFILFSIVFSISNTLPKVGTQ
jgi:hypothetical protein